MSYVCYDKYDCVYYLGGGGVYQFQIFEFQSCYDCDYDVGEYNKNVCCFGYWVFIL